LKEFPLVSAIVPSFDRGARVVSAIKSILAQDYDPIEILLIDDGSGDDTLERLCRFKRNAHEDA
jgi:glycosyltransferase involved in cell wall biosynthesis